MFPVLFIHAINSFLPCLCYILGMISDLVVLIVLSSDLLVVQFMCMPLIRKFCLSSESVEYLFCKWSMMWMQDVSLGGASSDVVAVLLL